MADSERGVASPADLKRIRYSDLRQALIDNYVTRGNKLELRSDGTETIVGLKQLDDYFAGMTANRITVDSIREFVKARESQGAGPAMINRSLQCLRRMLNIAREDGKIQIVPKIRLKKEPPARKGFLERNKFNELVAALPKHLRPLVTFLYWCGVRLGEALQIDWSQVDLDAKTIRLEDEQTKTGDPRIVPLPDVLIAMLKKGKGKVFAVANLRAEWARACNAVGLGKTEKLTSEDGNEWTRYNGLIVHDLRRSAVRNLINSGVPERVAMQITGHKTRAVFDRYHIVSAEDVKSAMARVEIGATLVQQSRRKRRKPSKGA
jgi:integrase